MFNFRTITCGDGSQIIDPSLKTPYESLTPAQMVDYTEMEKQIVYMERQKKKERKETGQKLLNSLLKKLADFCGIA